ncbi:MAG: hypothetical protein CFE26_24170, partial [Verrucomicrobiales bacterium VVV1]
GSSGNSTVGESEGGRLLGDAGRSAKQLVSRIQGLGISPESFDGILLTHEHGDHIRGLRVLLKQMPVPIYTTAATARVVKDTGIEGATWKIFDAGQAFRIGDVQVEAFAIQHDAVDPVGFVFQGPRAKFGLLSDAGFVTRGMVERLRGVHGLFVGHLSQDCNAPDLAMSILRKSLEEKGHRHIELHCACAEASPWWELAAEQEIQREQGMLVFKNE